MVVSLGEALIDFISIKGLEFKGFPGGSPYNTSIAVSRLGIPCRFLGRISRDMFGAQLLENLKSNGVGTELVVRTDDPSTMSFVKKQSDGQAKYAFFSNGAADRSWKSEELAPVELPEETKIIHFGSISLSQEPCGTVLEDFLIKHGDRYLLSFDPNIRPSLVPDRDVYMKRFFNLCGVSSIIKLSDEDLDWIFPGTDREEALKSLLDLGVSLIALTEGRKGARIMTKNCEITSPLYDLPVADTIGAGDTFHGAILSYFHSRDWITRETIENLTETQLTELGEYANKAAGINCSRHGANPPAAEEMEKDFLKS